MALTFDPKKYLKRFELSEFPQPDLVQLQHPVLLCHGYGGFLSMIAPSPMHESCLRLRSMGIEAFAPNTVPYAEISIRAEQWVSIIEKLQKQYGYARFNVVAHSMGGLDMRYAISKLGMESSVASLTTIASPHHGTYLADLALNAPEAVKEKLVQVIDWFGESIYPFRKSDVKAAVEQLTPAYVISEFNPNTPNAPGTKYFSYSAAVGKGTDSPLNPIYKLQNQLIYQQEGPNDSFVSGESAKWGIHVRTLGLGHVEQIEFQVTKERKPLVDTFWQELVINLQSHGL